MSPSGRLLPRGVHRGDAGSPGGVELLRDDLQAGRDRTAHATPLSTILDVLAGSSRAAEAPPPLLDPLSDAELRVVRYLPTNLKASEIGAELRVSANTVRTQLRRIYVKLDAHSRSEAVARARQLGLLTACGLPR
jgi:LuxR family transcriptional regulator, maltose regulon positive regulatory protein